MDVKIALLGPLAVQDAAGKPVGIGGRQLRVLLILLALRPRRVVPAGELAAELWPGEQPADPGNALQTLVSRLRAVFRAGGCDAVIESHPAGYRLTAATDVAEFERLAAGGRRALASGDYAAAARLLRGAELLWRGQPLADASGHEFAEGAAARLSALKTDAQLARIESEMALGEADALVAELRALTAADPLAEPPRALLMRALAAAGRPAAALAEYQDLRERLADQLGADPAPAVTEAYLRILRGEHPAERPAVSPPRHAPEPAPASAPAATAAPVPLTSFVGRDAELSRLAARLESARLVTLTGPGGVGKTRLATQAARDPARQWWFVPLAPVTDPSEVPYAVLDALGIRQRVLGRSAADAGLAAADPLDRLADALATADGVLIFDNCEHVIESVAALAARLLGDCPGVRVLATSREPLRIDGETLLTIPPLTVPPPPVPPVPGSPVPVPPAPLPAAPLLTARAPSDTTPEIPISEYPISYHATSDHATSDHATSEYPISEYAAVRLLCDRAAAVQPGFRLNAGNADDIGRIARALDGMPLAIELAAVWLRTLSPAQLAARLDDRFALLTGGSRTALPRHQTLRAVVDWSWELLSQEERVLARRLSVFPGGATLTAAEQVCAGDELPPAAVLPGLSGLVGKSFLQVDSDTRGSAPRYRMLETVRAYCLERLSAAGETRKARDAFAGYFLDLAESADPNLRGAAQGGWIRELAAEQDNLDAAIRWAIAGRDTETALRLVRALGWYWMIRGQPGEPVALAREVLAMGPGGATLVMAEARVICALTGAGPSWEMNMVRDDLVAAVDALAEWMPQWRSFHPLAALGEPMLALFDNEPERALAALDKFAGTDDPWERAAIMLIRASFGGTLGHDPAEAEASCRAALAVFLELGESWGAAGTLLNLSEMAETRGDFRAAIEAIQHAGELGRELGAWGDLPQIGAKLASVRIRAGDLASAREDLARAERDDARLGAYRSDATAYLVMIRAELEWRSGDLAAAIRSCEELLPWLGANMSAWWVLWGALVRARMGVLVLESGDRDRAREILAQALRDATARTDFSVLGKVIDSVAVFALSEDPALAARLLGAAHAVRGVFDEGSLDSPGVRDAARAALGEAAHEAAYAQGRALDIEEAVATAAAAIA